MATPSEDPITDVDRDRLFHEETCDNKAEGWKLVSQKEHAEVWRKNDDESPIHIVKGFLKFPGVPPEAVVEMVSDLSVRKRWDTQFPVIETIEDRGTYKVVYWRVKMPPPVSDRDLVQFTALKHDEDNKAWYTIYKNGEHASKPPQPGIVRAETILSGSIIRADKNDPSSTTMCVLLQNDAKGLIPKFITNFFQSNAPGTWRDTMYNFFMNEYSTEYWQKHPKNEQQ